MEATHVFIPMCQFWKSQPWDTRYHIKHGCDPWESYPEYESTKSSIALTLRLGIEWGSQNRVVESDPNKASATSNGAKRPPKLFRNACPIGLAWFTAILWNRWRRDLCRQLNMLKQRQCTPRAIYLSKCMLYVDRRPGYKSLDFCQEFPNFAEESKLGKVFVSSSGEPTTREFSLVCEKMQLTQWTWQCIGDPAKDWQIWGSLTSLSRMH